MQMMKIATRVFSSSKLLHKYMVRMLTDNNATV